MAVAKNSEFFRKIPSQREIFAYGDYGHYSKRSYGFQDSKARLRIVSIVSINAKKTKNPGTMAGKFALLVLTKFAAA